MKELFSGFLSVSLSGSIAVAVILGLRLIFRKSAPKKLFCVLWLIAILRLLLPFQIETEWSLRPTTPIITGYDTQVLWEAVPVPMGEVPSFIPQITMDSRDMVIIDYVRISALVWIIGVCILGIYALHSYWQLKYRLLEAVRIEDGIYQHEKLRTAILIGYLRPRIYLPTGMTKEDTEFVITHERAHCHRGDNWLKLMGYICLCVHWFNPLIWLAFHLLSSDIEDACDEQVIKNMEPEKRKAYSSALLSCGKRSNPVGVGSVAFGETDIRKRVLKVLNYKKPALWISIVLIVSIILTAVFFMTDPAQKYPPYYQELTSLLGEPLSVVCDALGCSEDEILMQQDDVSGYAKTPIRVEYLGIPFELHIFMDRNVFEGLYAFAYVAEYTGNNEQAAKDIVTVSRHQWKYFGEGLYAQVDKSLLSYISEEDVLMKIGSRRTTGLINDTWDFSKSKHSVKRYLREIKESDEWNNYYSSGDRKIEATPAFYGNYSAYLKSREQGTDSIVVCLRYRLQKAN